MKVDVQEADIALNSADTVGETSPDNPGGTSGGAPERVAAEDNVNANGAACCSFVTGDRLCTKCGYNLIGQSIFREPHYDLLIVRCPECGTAAGVQEYPLLGPWAHRWGLVAAALWFLFILAAWSGASSAIFGLAFGPAEESAWKYGQYLTELHSAHEEAVKQQQAQTPPTSTPTQPSNPPTTSAGNVPNTITIPALPSSPGKGPTTIVLPGGVRTIITGPGSPDFQKWWQQQDRQAILASAGGWAGAVDWVDALFWLPGSLVAFLIGGFWAVVLIPLKRRGLLIWGLIILGAAWLFTLIPLHDWAQPPSYAYRAARQQLSPGLLFLNLAVLTLPLALGLLLGRSCTRLAVRGLLPPRLRHSLAILWTTDGKQPPLLSKLG